LFDITHNYYKGKNVAVAYENGKQKGAEQQQNIRKFIKPKPQAAPPQTEEDDKDMPQMLKASLRHQGAYLA
jgi:hypothetical protein